MYNPFLNKNAGDRFPYYMSEKFNELRKSLSFDVSNISFV